MCSGLRGAAPRCLTRKNADMYCTTPCVGMILTKTPVSIIFRGKCSKFLFRFFWAMQHRCLSSVGKRTTLYGVHVVSTPLVKQRRE